MASRLAHYDLAHTAGVQLPEGGGAGKKFAQHPSPSAVEELMSAKGAAELWAELKVKLGESYSGSCFKGATVNPILNSYKERFAQKGLAVFYLATNTEVGFGGDGMDTTSAGIGYSWLEILDMKVAPEYVPSVPARKGGCTIS